MNPFTATTHFVDILAAFDISTFPDTGPVIAHRSTCNQAHICLDSTFTSSVGLPFAVRYLGYLPIVKSIHGLSPQTRVTFVTNCIRFIREAVAQNAGQSGNANSRVANVIGGQLNVSRGGSDAIVSVTREHLTIVLTNSAETWQHPMSAVSFALASEDGQHAAIVVKDPNLGRLCMVFNCTMISSYLALAISQVFDLRAAQQLDHEPTALAVNPPLQNFDPVPAFNEGGDANQQTSSDDFKQEGWYHGGITRQEAEKRIRCDGDFLVRDSGTVEGEVVLSGMLNGKHHHLLLVDPVDKKIRTLNGTVYASVKAFIYDHMLSDREVDIVGNNGKLKLYLPIMHAFHLNEA